MFYRDDGCKAFADALRHNSKLRELGLWSNPSIDSEVARRFEQVLKFDNHSIVRLSLNFCPEAVLVKKTIESFASINSESHSPFEAYVRKTHLFPKSHLHNLTKEGIVLPSAMQRLGSIGSSLSVTFCFVRETHAAVLECWTDRKKRKSLICD